MGHKLSILGIAILVATATLAVAPVPAAAAELTVLAGGAAKAGLVVATLEFEAQSGAKVRAEFAPMGKVVASLAAGATPDIVVVTEDVLPDVSGKGFVVAASATEVGRVGVGVAVKADAPSPDIATPEAFKAALLAAKSIVMIDPATGTSGKHLAKVFADLGIWDALKPKLTFGAGGYVVEPVGKGEIELGLHQITEILPVKGIKLVGPLPGPLQKVTVYIAVIGTKAKEPDLARRFLEHIKTPPVREALTRSGFMAAP